MSMGVTMEEHNQIEQREEHWTVDRRFPVFMILGFIVQTLALLITGAIWVANINNRIEALEKVEVSRNSHGDRIIVLEQAVPYIRSDLSEIKALLKELQRSRP